MEEYRCKFCHKLLFKLRKDKKKTFVEGLKENNTLLVWDNYIAESEEKISGLKSRYLLQKQ